MQPLPVCAICRNPCHKLRSKDSFAINIQNPFSDLYDLDDECLLSVCKVMTLKDQLAFALTCERFYQIFETVCRTQYRLVKTEWFEPLLPQERVLFLKIAGPFITEIGDFYQSGYFNHIFFVMLEQCENVRTLTLRKCYRPHKVIFESFPCITHLRFLGLDCCCIRDDDILFLTKMQDLEGLSLRMNDITGLYLSHFHKLRYLNLHSCLLLEPVYFVNMCRSNPNLEVLNIWECIRLDTKAFEDMVTYLRNLVDLTMCCTTRVHYECVARLPKLKHLRLISFLIPLRHKLFQELVRLHAHTLETLKIEYFGTYLEEFIDDVAQMSNLKQITCIDNYFLSPECGRKFGYLKNLEKAIFKSALPITNEIVLHLIANCEKLKYINVEYCPQITCNLIFDAIDILLERNEPQPSKPLQIFARRSRIYKCYLQHPKYMMNRHLLHVTLEEDLNEKDDFAPYRYDDDDFCLQF